MLSCSQKLGASSLCSGCCPRYAVLAVLVLDIRCVVLAVLVLLGVVARKAVLVVSSSSVSALVRQCSSSS
ncbi:hypothetical protein BDZ89DRAFT_1066457 [Hymenopellis radicata]|nr:hypothetical protein BDZ89DRAFT_1066457 [Hymenopellis radicata]